MFLNEDDELFVKSLVTMMRHLQREEGRTRRFYEECLQDAKERGTLPGETRKLIQGALDIVYRDEATA